MIDHPPTVIRINIQLVAIVAFLHLFGFGLVFLLPLPTAPAAVQALAGVAWAAEEKPGMLETAPSITAGQRPPDQPQGSSVQPPSKQEEVPEVLEELQMKKSFLDLLHSEISRRLLSSATWLDSFFGDDRYLLEQNSSYLRFRYDVFQEEKSNMLLKPTIDLRLVLPQLQRKSHLVFSAEPSQTPTDTGTPVTPAGERIPNTDQRNLTTALQYFVRSTPRESFIVRTGVQLPQGKPALFIAPRYRALIALDSWDFRFTQEVMYRTDTKWQTDTILDFERILSPTFFFRQSIEGLWFESAHGYFYNLTTSLRQALSRTHALDYEWVNIYQTRPTNELAEIAFRVRYRHSFWREWLFLEVAPQIRFPRTRNFEMLPGILFRIETFFGGKR